MYPHFKEAVITFKRKTIFEHFWHVFITVLFLTAFIACGNGDFGNGQITAGVEEPKASFEGLSLELENRIKQDYFDNLTWQMHYYETNPDVKKYFTSLGKEGVHIKQYYGTYNGMTVILICCAYINMCSPVQSRLLINYQDIGINFEFFFPWSNIFSAWHDGKFYNLTPDLFTPDIYNKIYNIHASADISSETCESGYCPFIPKLLIPEVLCKKTENMILQDLQDTFPYIREPYANNFLKTYYGTYNGSIVFLSSGIGGGAAHIVRFVAGIAFWFPGGELIIRVWNERKLYDLQEAYNFNLLTREDLKSISYYHDYYYNRFFY